MTSASMSFGRPVRVTFPRGSLWFGNLAAVVIEALSQRPSKARAVAQSQITTSTEPLSPRCRAWTQKEEG